MTQVNPQTGKELTTVQAKAKSLKEYLHSDNIKEQFASAMPEWLSVDRMLRVIFTSILKNPKILECTRESILSSVMQCCQLGLEPILGRAHLIPYQNSKYLNGQWIKVYECQFQPGYQGLIDLARRSGDIVKVSAHVVCENDPFDEILGSNEEIIHSRPKRGVNRGDIIGAYATWTYKNGVKSSRFMPIEDIYKRRDVSQAYQYAASQLKKDPKNKNALKSPWIAWEEEMIIKTVIKYSSKFESCSIEFMQAVALDERADMGKTQVGMFSDTDLDSEMPFLDYEAEIKVDEEEQKEEAVEYDLSNFYELVKKQTGQDFEYKTEKQDPMSKFIKETAKKQKPKAILPEQLMADLNEKSFPAFINAYRQWDTKRKASVNPFDDTDWKSSKMGKPGLKKFYDDYHQFFNDASEEGKLGFYDIWRRRFNEREVDPKTGKKLDWIEDFPFNWRPVNDQYEIREADDDEGQDDPAGSGQDDNLIDRTEDLQMYMNEREELYLKACENLGLNSMATPDLLDEQQKVWDEIMELLKTGEYEPL